MRIAAILLIAAALVAPALAATGNPVAGRVVFRSKCGTCHTLKAAATVAKNPNSGPVLTNKRETAARIMRQLLGGGSGVMPTFVGVLTQKQIADVVAYVVQASKPAAR
jgi:mono/diheme cytochrome c family protein